MRYFYKVYGLNFCSQDLEFPQLIPLLSDNKIIDVNIFKDNLKNWSPLKNSKFDTEFLIINSKDIRIFIDNVVIIKISEGKNISWDKLNQDLDDRDIIPFIMSTGIGSILIQRNNLVLHGNALEKNGDAICCIGPSGFGKSTIAYAMNQNGWNLFQ